MQSERLPPEVKIATSTCEIRNSTYTQAVRNAFLKCTLVRPPIRSHHHKFLARRPPACRFRAPGESRSQALIVTQRTPHRPKLSPMQSDHLTPEMQSMTPMSRTPATSMRITPPAISIARGVPHLETIRKLMLDLLCCGTDPPHQKQNRSIYRNIRRQTITPTHAERAPATRSENCELNL